MLGPEHPNILTSRINFVAALGGLAEYRRAAELHQQTLAARERVLGPEHPATLANRYNLALALNAVGRRWWRWPRHKVRRSTRPPGIS